MESKTKNKEGLLQLSFKDIKPIYGGRSQENGYPEVVRRWEGGRRGLLGLCNILFLDLGVGCCFCFGTKLLQTWLLNTTEISCLTVLEARSQKLSCRQAPSENSSGQSVPCPSSYLVAPAAPYGRISPFSAFRPYVAFFCVCVLFCLLQGHLSLHLGPIQDDLISRFLI